MMITMNQTKNKTLKNKTFVFLLLGTLLLASALYFYGRQALGTSSPATACNLSGNPATTSPVFMTPGRATTTLTCNVSRVDSFTLLAMLVASSTDTEFQFRVERSLNNSDYFAEVFSVNELASTTRLTGDFSQYTIRYATSTGGTSQTVGFGSGSGTGSTTANFIHFSIPTLGADYVRVVSYLRRENNLTATTTNGAIWMQGIRDENLTR